jgi:hypothetical protein
MMPLASGDCWQLPSFLAFSGPRYGVRPDMAWTHVHRTADSDMEACTVLQTTATAAVDVPACCTHPTALPMMWFMCSHSWPRAYSSLSSP